MNKMPIFKSVRTHPLLKGITDQATNDKTKVIKGANKKTTLSEPDGITISLNTYLKKSANDCKMPKAPTTLGPFLICTAAQIFLSAYIKKAKLNNTPIVINRH